MQITPDQQRAAAMEARLQNLAESVFEHEALNNEFYERWMEGPLRPEQVKIFARNYLARTVNTATMVALSVISTDDVVARVEIVKNLFSEYGYGDPAKAHIVLLEQFMTELLSRLEGKGFDLRRSRRHRRAADDDPADRGPASALYRSGPADRARDPPRSGVARLLNAHKALRRRAQLQVPLRHR